MEAVKEKRAEDLRHDVHMFRSLVADYDRRVAASMLEMERMEVISTLKRIESLLSKYVDKKQRIEGEWTYYKKIPSRYWHEMYHAYRLFMEMPEHKLRLYTKDERKNMYLYIRVLPALAKFDKVLYSGKGRFNVLQRLYYDHIWRG
jgi:hypothetical protein